MTQPVGWSDKVGFVWGVADLLRGDFKAHEYGQVILPLVVLRRLECALEPTKAAVREAASTLGDNPAAGALLAKAAKHSFYNVSPLDLTKILNDPGTAAKNLRTYLAAFSPNAREVLDAYGFDSRIAQLDKAGLLYQVLARFADLDLSEAAVPNETMGYIFEELLRRFSEMSNETAGEHFTPREVIKLMVNILFVEDDAALRGTRPVRTLYDPACGTGGMLTVAQDYLRELNPSAVLEVYGQELNPETWAVCRSDLMIKGQNPNHIALGNSLGEEDGHRTLRADYQLANPPFGVDWKKYADAINAERDERGMNGRYGAGTPRVSDGSLLFLQHMISKMKPVAAPSDTGGSGGGRLAIVFSGSPLFAGAAGGGESEIRRWIIENDWLEGIVALPDQLFYNTGISTYFWVLTNRKPAHRRGKIALIDARESFAKMRKSLGDKRKFVPDDAIAEVTRLYHDAIEIAAAESDKRVKVFDREAFGFQRITVERPLRRVWHLTAEAVEDLVHTKAWTAWATPPKNHADPTAYVHAVEADQAALRENLRKLADLEPAATEKAFAKTLAMALGACVTDPPAAVAKAITAAAAVASDDAPVIADRHGNPLPDPDLRDAENVPLPAGWLSLGEDERTKALRESAEAHLAAEIHPYAPDAWIDHTKTKVGFEIPFTRHFYEYVPPRPLAEIDAELLATEERIRELLSGLVR
ncbi:MAG: type I restriction-modification system subunit M [Sporichthyaceae bacterium]